MKEHEKAKKLGRTARRIAGKLSKQPVLMVTKIDENGNLITCFTQQEIFQACAHSNLHRQLKALSSPFLQYPLLHHIGYCAERPGADQILQGTFSIPVTTDQYTRELIQELRIPQSLADMGPMDIKVTTNIHTQGWRKQKEATASEPTALSFSHYKAMVDHQTLASVDSQMRDIPIQHGFSPQSWRRITDIEILKETGEYNVDRMRLIQLMASPFNINNKLIGKRMMDNAEKHNILPPDQHGSRRNHRANLVALNKKLTMDIMRQKRHSGAIAMNDAEGCYDRVAHPVDALAMRRAGVSCMAALMMVSTLQLAAHSIATGLGISTPQYGGPQQDPPVQGTGQGNGRAPQSWALISAILISIMYKNGHGAKFTSAITNTFLHMACFAFVDDTNTLQTGPNIDTPAEELIPMFQQAMDRWSGLLKSTGGALRPKKCYWYFIDFKWKQGRWCYKSIDDSPGEIFIPHNVSGIRVPITRYEVNHAEETLGCWLSMDGNEKKAMEVITKKAKLFGDQIRTSKVSRNEAWYAFEKCFLPSIEYLLPVLTLSKDQWTQILRPALNPTLSAAGIASTFPRVVLFGTPLFQGLGLAHPWYKQCFEHVTSFVEALVNQTQTGALLKPQRKNYDWNVGVGKIGIVFCLNSSHI